MKILIALTTVALACTTAVAGENEIDRRSGGAQEEARHATLDAKDLQRLLLSPMEPGDPIQSGGWRLKNPHVETARGQQPKMGRFALVFSGEAEVAGSKAS